MDVNRISCPVVATIEEGSSDDLMESDDEDSEFTEVCGTDQQTYQSICHLLQTSTNVSILHTGACNVGECQARKVRVLEAIFSCLSQCYSNKSVPN